MYKKVRLQVKIRVSLTSYTTELATCPLRVLRMLQVSRVSVTDRKLAYASLEHSKTTSRV